MKPSTSENRLICLVCRKQFSLYTCPRCNVRYCSLPCYRSHSARCLESFNRDNVLANLQDCVATPDTRKRMLKSLQRFHSTDAMDDHLGGGEGDSDDGEDDDDDDDGNVDARACILSETTLSKLASGEDIKISDLSPEEKKAFLRAVRSGEFSHMIKPWEPWWLSPLVKKIVLTKDGNRAIQPVGNMDMLDTDCENDVFDVPPPWDSPLPPLKHLTPKPPSPLLGVHLAEVLYSYCFTLRFFNGDWTCDFFDAALTCLSVSHVLGQSTSPRTLSEALNSCFETICSPFFKFAGGYKFALTLLDDAVALLYVGRPGVICALSDLHRMLDKASKDAKQERARKKGHRQLDLAMGAHKTKASSSSDLKAVCKKIFYLLCWANEQPAEVFSALALLLEKEKAHILDTHESSVLTCDTKGHRENRMRKAFVEEIIEEP